MSHIPTDMNIVTRSALGLLEMTPLNTLKVLKECQKQWIAVILELRARKNTLWSCRTPMRWISPTEGLIGIYWTKT